MSDDQNQNIDEEVVETEEGGQNDCQEKLAKLKDKLKVCEVEKGEYLDGWQRSKADYANFKREVAEREKESERRVKARLIENLLPVLESIGHARRWIKDLAPIEAQLENVLAGYGLEKVGVEGETFDPYKHESVENVEVAEESRDNIIIELVSEGYAMEGRIIKPAKVKVGILIKNT